MFAAVSPVQILDLTGPFEIFARTGEYRVEVATAAADGCVRSSCGLTIAGAIPYDRIRAPIDTLLVPGGDGAEEIDCDQRFLRWLASAGSRARRAGSICTGAFLLAACGLLDGRRAVTHWGWCTKLAKQFPKVRVEQDPIFIKDGSLYTSAGVTAGLDLALALVEEDHGRERALAVARDLVMFLRRPGGQSQFSSLLESQAAERDMIGDLRPWILGNMKSDLSVAALARHCRDERQALRPNIYGREGRHTGALRRTSARRGGSDSAGKHALSPEGGRCAMWIRQRRLDAAFIPASDRCDRGTVRVSSSSRGSVTRCYSERRASTGLTEAARRAGMKLARRAAMPSRPATAARVARSHERTPNSSPRIRVAAATEHTRPIAMPKPVNSPASFRMS